MDELKWKYSFVSREDFQEKIAFAEKLNDFLFYRKTPCKTQKSCRAFSYGLMYMIQILATIAAGFQMVVIDLAAGHIPLGSYRSVFCSVLLYCGIVCLSRDKKPQATASAPKKRPLNCYIQRSLS